jgi:hypothetical protein
MGNRPNDGVAGICPVAGYQTSSAPGDGGRPVTLGHSFTPPQPDLTVTAWEPLRAGAARHSQRNDRLLALAQRKGRRSNNKHWHQQPRSHPRQQSTCTTADIAATPTKRAARLSRPPITSDIPTRTQNPSISTKWNALISRPGSVRPCSVKDRATAQSGLRRRSPTSAFAHARSRFLLRTCSAETP